MNVKNWLAWADALESGKYPQGRYALATVDGPIISYCCLGVVCEIAGLERRGSVYGSYFKEEIKLPLKAQRWLGVSESDPMVNGEHATYYNDSLELTFPQIAAKIREHVKQYQKEHGE